MRKPESSRLKFQLGPIPPESSVTKRLPPPAVSPMFTSLRHPAHTGSMRPPSESSVTKRITLDRDLGASDSHRAWATPERGAQIVGAPGRVSSLTIRKGLGADGNPERTKTRRKQEPEPDPDPNGSGGGARMTRC